MRLNGCFSHEAVCNHIFLCLSLIMFKLCTTLEPFLNSLPVPLYTFSLYQRCSVNAG